MLIPNYRNNGAVGALLDEYERAIHDLKRVISALQMHELTTIIDRETEDPDCKSIQTILTHVVRSAWGYATYIRQSQNEQLAFPVNNPRDTIAAYLEDLDAIFHFMEQTFEKYPTIELESFDEAKKMRVRWGQLYDVEQLMEHAIVHILRHRRQIERFILKLNVQN